MGTATLTTSNCIAASQDPACQVTDQTSISRIILVHSHAVSQIPAHVCHSRDGQEGKLTITGQAWGAPRSEHDRTAS